MLHRANPLASFSIAEVKRLVPHQASKEHVSGGWARPNAAQVSCVTPTCPCPPSGQAPNNRHAPPACTQAVITFDLDADLRSVFSWNTKQLFVYLQAEYETPENGLNQIALWDAIVQQQVTTTATTAA